GVGDGLGHIELLRPRFISAHPPGNDAVRTQYAGNRHDSSERGEPETKVPGQATGGFRPRLASPYHTCSRRGAKRRMERGMQSIRLAHISDIHVGARSRWRADDWFNKRLFAWLNLRLLGRGRRFRHTDTVLTALVEELQQRRPDRVVFSGDATALGFEEEIARAATLLGLH